MPPFCMWHALVTRQLLIEWYTCIYIYHSMFHGYTLLLRLWTPDKTEPVAGLSQACWLITTETPKIGISNLIIITFS